MLFNNLRHAELSWLLLEAKICYYGFFYVNRESALTDSEYDSMSKEYLTLCRVLNSPNTIIHKAYPSFEDIGLAPIQPKRTPSIDLILRRIAMRIM